MKKNTPQQAIERFHLLFLFHFGQLVDKRHYILKGGCNLRFFMKSIRYSEDIDLDIQIVAATTLEKNVDKVLHSLALKKTLQAHAITLMQYSKPKQTETTQRWKILLQRQGTTLTIPTKIEFSRRGVGTDYSMAQVDPILLKDHGLFPIFVQHYSAEEALSQKIEALALRNQTQARDVFDIDLLISRATAPSRQLQKELIQTAVQQCLSLSFGDYKAQVVAYLDHNYSSVYDSEAIWESLQLKVVHYMEHLIHETH